MTKKIGNPFRVFDIRLSTGNIAHMLSIDNNRVQVERFKDIVQRFPVRTGAFHSDGLTMIFQEPIRQREKFTSGSTEFLDLGALLLTKTGDDQFLVNINTTTNRIKIFHKQNSFSNKAVGTAA